MFLLTLDNISDLNILQNIYMSIYNYKLFNQIFIVFKPDIKSKTYKIPNLIYNVVKVDLTELVNCTKEELEDIMFDLIELNTNVLFDKGEVSKTFVRKVEDICSSTGLLYRYYGDTGLDKEIDLKNLTFNELNIIFDIFEKKRSVRMYTPRDFLVRVSVNNEGILSIKKGEKVGSILEDGFINVLFKAYDCLSKHINYVEKVYDSPSNSCFEYSLYEPWAFLEYDKDIFTKIETYKWKIFEAIKNIDPRQYMSLSIELVELLNEREYIQLKDILPIVSNEDTILNYYK